MASIITYLFAGFMILIIGFVIGFLIGIISQME